MTSGDLTFFEIREKRRRQIAVFLGVAIFIAVISALAVIRVPIYRDFYDPVSGIFVRFPNDWPGLYRPEGGAVVVFLAPKASQMDDVHESVNITVQNLADHPMEVERFAEVLVKQLTGTFTGFVEMLDAGPVRVGKYKGYQISWRGVIPEKYRKNEELKDARPVYYSVSFTIQDNLAYIIMYAGKKPGYDKLLGKYRTIVKTFDLRDPPKQN